MVRIENVHKRYGNLEVLKGINLDVEPSEVVCIIGASGSGKTTLLRCINFLETYESGRIYVDNELVGYRERDGRLTPAREKDIARVRAETAMVFQQFNLFPHMTALANVAFGPIKVRGVARDEANRKARELLARVGLVDKADVYPAQLSGGQQQRVAIAQAIVDDAELLLLDEPLANLDLRNQQEIVRLLGELHRERDVTILVVAHDLNPLLPVLTEAVYLLDGHPHHDPITDVVQEELLTHLYGTPVGVVRTAQGDLFTRAAWRDPHR
jgi:zinc/manganese transport system ATP-binding protein